MQLLSFATNYWSKGTVKSLFLEHEVGFVLFGFKLLIFIFLFSKGYFGAVGCLRNFISKD
jgi:hypothetical protein